MHLWHYCTTRWMTQIRVPDVDRPHESRPETENNDMLSIDDWMMEVAKETSEDGSAIRGRQGMGKTTSRRRPLPPPPLQKGIWALPRLPHFTSLSRTPTPTPAPTTTNSTADGRISAIAARPAPPPPSHRITSHAAVASPNPAPAPGPAFLPDPSPPPRPRRAAPRHRLVPATRVRVRGARARSSPPPRGGV